MGQRTQLVLKIKDLDGNVTNKVFHEQWGFGKTMPMIILNFLTDIYYGKQKANLDPYTKKELKDLTLSSWETTEEYNSDDYGVAYVVKDTHIKYRKNNQYGYDLDLRKNDLRVVLTDEQKENLQELVTWDFDINDAQNVNLFMGDNNDGMSVVSIEAKSDRDYDVKIGFVKSNGRKYVSPDTYMKQVKNYYDKDFSKSFYQICKMFDVEILK